MKVTVIVETDAGETSFEKHTPSNRRMDEWDSNPVDVRGLIDLVAGQAKLAYPDVDLG